MRLNIETAVRLTLIAIKQTYTAALWFGFRCAFAPPQTQMRSMAQYRSHLFLKKAKEL